MLTIILLFIFVRPFISSIAFPCLNATFSFLLLCALGICLIKHRIAADKLNQAKYPILLFCFSLLVSTALSLNILRSFEGIYISAAGILIFASVASFAESDKKRLIRVIAFAGLVISLMAIYQYFFGFRHTLQFLDKNGIADPFARDYLSRNRIFFPFMTPNTLGGYLAMVIPLTLLYKDRILFIIPMGLALVLTKSLGGIISLFVALLVLFYLRSKNKKKTAVSLILISAVTAAIIFTRTLSPKLHTQPAFSALMRIDYWKQTWELIKISPLCGIGVGNFNLALSRFAHNSYLQIWAEMGSLGILSFLWLVSRAIKISLRKAKDNPRVIFLLASVSAFLFHNLIDFSFFLPEVSWIWWAVLGLLIA